MISNKYKCIFIHIPKAAGQSVEHFFLKHHNLSWKDRAPLLLRYNPKPEMGPERLAHLTADEYVNCGHIRKDKFEAYFKFSFVRNPWSRIVSEYNYRDYHKKLSFKEFLIEGLPDKSSYSDAYRHLLPQYDFLHDDSGNLIVDFVGKFEQLQTDFDYVCDQLGFHDSELPHINSSKKKSRLQKILSFEFKKSNDKRKHYTEYYDEESKKIVEDMYLKDIETFAYQFGE
ncbi:sulfotransferase family 2 domain-containing protein [Catenovulum adriaticum]|uniref:Sulfotransferase family protein n=1 Tax=Catenovulum adriaticum TaxID=2984846 RepID=A0ABY7APN4_9ALTE|nr:sulfotransferase family 2 domain-containing protein [Catenovulum sp. TS8]WAJ70692.1 sulfotransferase family protein [Catenovulum sp. TS8]